jgi:hypothetical protein
MPECIPVVSPVASLGGGLIIGGMIGFLAGLLSRL